MSLGYNTICPKCKDRYTSEGVKDGEIAVKRCAACPPVALPVVVKPSVYYNRKPRDRRKALPSLTGDRHGGLPGEYEDRRRGKRERR